MSPRNFSVAIAMLLVAVAPSLADPDRIETPPQPALSATAADRAEGVAPAALGSCQSSDLQGRWSMTLDHDFGTLPRAPLDRCKVRIQANGNIAVIECKRQGSETAPMFSGALKMGSDCAVKNKKSGVPIRLDVFVFRISAVMSGDRTRITGDIIGHSTGLFRGRFEAVRLP